MWSREERRGTPSSLLRFSTPDPKHRKKGGRKEESAEKQNIIGTQVDDSKSRLFAFSSPNEALLPQCLLTFSRELSGHRVAAHAREKIEI